MYFTFVYKCEVSTDKFTCFQEIIGVKVIFEQAERNVCKEREI